MQRLALGVVTSRPARCGIAGTTSVRVDSAANFRRGIRHVDAWLTSFQARLFGEAP
jgi:hypothetical protein